MTDQATRIVPAGWYEDPASPAHVRWWNGLVWTEHTSVKPTDQVPPLQQEPHPGPTAVDPEAIKAARIAEARRLEREYGISTDEHDVMVEAAHTGVEEDAYRPDWGADTEPKRTATASSWLIALWPVLTLVALAAAAYLYYYVSPTPLVLAVGAVPLLLTVVWAIADHRKLRRFGHEPASAAFALLGPLVYLVARRTRVRGWGPLATFVVLLLISAGLPLAAWSTGAARPLWTALEIQQTVTADLVGQGIATSVSCPLVIESSKPGTLYTCSAVLPGGETKSVWVSIDSSDGDFSYSLSVR